MPLKEQLGDDLKNAMRQGDALRRTTIRSLLSAMHNDEIARQKDLDEDGVIQVLTKQAQQRRDSIEAFRGADRQDLVDKEQAELEIIAAYLPEQMTEDEYSIYARRTGQLMKQKLKDNYIDLVEMTPSAARLHIKDLHQEAKFDAETEIYY